MSGRIMKMVGLLREPGLLKTLASLRYNGHLHGRGWFNSIRAAAPVDTDGNPLPWMTYPFIDFIERRIRPDMDVFEYGSGNSTRYFAARVRSITSVEHDRQWFETIKAGLPANAKLLFVELDRDGAYCRASSGMGTLYDIVIVDGRDRVHCVKESAASLKPDGVMILDDAQRPEYNEGIQFLLARGFRQISFTGMAPCNVEEKHTDIFYRASNCLEI